MPLPAPPSNLPAKPGTAPVAEREKPSSCQVCGQDAKYTCPRCGRRTCSVACSRAHKAADACSGVRNPAAYVPLNRISQGTWDGDYAWLEAGRRAVAAWGEGVSPEEAERAARGEGSARGRGGSGARGRPARSKRDGLRWAAAEIGAAVDTVPDGMQRRRTNQSSWNPNLHLTVQFALSPALADTEAQTLTHARVPVLPAPGATLASLLPDAVRYQQPVLVLPYHYPRSRETPDPSAPSRAPRFFTPLDGAAPISRALRGTAFVEFPTVRVFARAEWMGMLAAGAAAVVPRFETSIPEPPAAVEAAPAPGGVVPAKRARPEELGLGLGDYGSSSEAEDSEGEAQGDITLSPRMAAALGQALEADFGGPGPGDV